MLIAVLTVSDRCSQGQLADTAGPAVVALIEQQWPGAEIWTGLLPDDEDAIAAKLEELQRRARRLCSPWAARDWARATARRRRHGA